MNLCVFLPKEYFISMFLSRHQYLHPHFLFAFPHVILLGSASLSNSSSFIPFIIAYLFSFALSIPPFAKNLLRNDARWFNFNTRQTADTSPLLISPAVLSFFVFSLTSSLFLLSSSFFFFFLLCGETPSSVETWHGRTSSDENKSGGDKKTGSQMARIDLRLWGPQIHFLLVSFLSLLYIFI